MFGDRYIQYMEYHAIHGRHKGENISMWHPCAKLASYLTNISLSSRITISCVQAMLRIIILMNGTFDEMSIIWKFECTKWK